MKNILIEWVLPTTREQGGPLTPADIDRVEIELSADGGANFSAVGPFAPDVLSTNVNDLPFSDQYVVRGTVFDSAQQSSAPVLFPFELADDSAPSGLAGLTVTPL